MGVRGVSGQELRALVPPTSAPETHRAPPKPVGEADATSPAPEGPHSQETPNRQTVRQQASVEPSRPRRSGTRLHVDPNVHRIVAEIVDENNEVIKQIPPEEMLRIAAKFRELTGLLFEENV